MLLHTIIIVIVIRVVIKEEQPHVLVMPPLRSDCDNWLRLDVCGPESHLQAAKTLEFPSHMINCYNTFSRCVYFYNTLSSNQTVALLGTRQMMCSLSVNDGGVNHWPEGNYLDFLSLNQIGNDFPQLLFPTQSVIVLLIGVLKIVIVIEADRHSPRTRNSADWEQWSLRNRWTMLLFPR